jgi:hypothetical protein
MPYVTKPRPYKKEYQQQKARGEHDNRMERQRARRGIDKKMPDGQWQWQGRCTGGQRCSPPQGAGQGWL